MVEEGAAALPQYGLVAEEVAEVAPQLVVYDEVGKPYTVRYRVLAPMLLNELQQQQARSDGLEVRIEALLARVAELESSRGDGKLEPIQ